MHAKSLVAAPLVALLLVGTRGHGGTERPLLLQGTVVTMDGAHHVLRHGSVLVRDGVIEAVWGGAPPGGVSTAGARVVRSDLVFPGLIDLHDHPSFDVLPLWTPPRKYASRYEWSLAPPASYVRRVQAPHDALSGIRDDVLLSREAESALAGETALEGAGSPGTPSVLIREIEGTNFGRADVEAWVPSIGNFTGAPALRDRIAHGETHAWLVHLAEGVRDVDRRELDTVRSYGLLTSALVVIHGTAFDRSDFAALGGAGAKLVWSPTSNLLLYGRTADVYDALAAGVDVSLGTDWTPSGSPTLLDELKVADITLRDRRILGKQRTLGNAALDRLLADMVTRNPAQALGWTEVGSLEPGKHADVLMLRRPRHTPTGGMPGSPYRSLIDATERDVRLVLLDGAPLAGDRDALRAAGAQTVQLVRSTRGRFTKVVATADSLAAAQIRVRRVLRRFHLTSQPLFTVDDRRFFGVLAHGAGAPFARFATRWYRP